MESVKTYIVTGATGGIGQEIVRKLAERGNCRIVLAVRNTQSAHEMIAHETTGAKDVEFQVMALDLARLESVDEMAKDFLGRGWRLDGLINNAGIMPAGISITQDGYELATQVNYLATRRLTEKLLPALGKDSVIVFTTSVTRHLVKDSNDWAAQTMSRHGLLRRYVTYGQSKRLITSYAHDLAKRLAKQKIRVNCVDPGVVNTKMLTLGHSVVDKLADIFFRPLTNTPEQAAWVTMRALDSPKTAYVFGLKKEKRNAL